MDGVVIITKAFNSLRMTLPTINIQRGGTSAKGVLGKTCRMKEIWSALVISSSGGLCLQLISTYQKCLKEFKGLFEKELQNADAAEGGRQTMRCNRLDASNMNIYSQDVSFIYAMLDKALSKLTRKHSTVS